MYKWLKKIFLTEKDDSPYVSIAIVLNAVIIFALAFPEIQYFDNIYSILIIFDDVLLAFFVLEAIIKVNEFREKYFYSILNIIDLVIAVLALPALCMVILAGNHAKFASLLVLLRLLRLFRLTHLLVLLPKSKEMAKGLKRALKASVFVIFTLLVYNLVLAILGTHLLNESKLFADPLTSAYTIFQMFTVEGWNEIPEKMRVEGCYNESLTWIKLAAILVVLTGGIFGMSLANAIFVDEMTMDNNNKLEQKIDRLQTQIDNLEKLLTKK